jgi:hypothetical protein
VPQPSSLVPQPLSLVPQRWLRVLQSWQQAQGLHRRRRFRMQRRRS